jgi:hypothetical protein
MTLLSRSIVVLTLPSVVFAQTLGSLVDNLLLIISGLIGVLVALSVVVFFYGMAMYVFRMGSGSTESHQSGYQLMIWGVVVFFVMASVWGIIRLVSGSLF